MMEDDNQNKSATMAWGISKRDQQNPNTLPYKNPKKDGRQSRSTVRSAENANSKPAHALLEHAHKLSLNALPPRIVLAQTL